MSSSSISFVSEQPSSPEPGVPSGRPPVRFDNSVALLEVLSRVPDPRDPRGVRHPLVGIVAVAVCAVVAGSRSFAAIAQWAADLAPADLIRLGLRRSVAPDEATFRRLLSCLDAGLLDSLIGSFMWTRTSIIAGRRVIAIDGKTIRGARTRASSAPHLVAALDHATGVVLGQLATAAKSNEIPTVRSLLQSFELDGVLVTVDAMHTQTDTATVIVEAGGDYVFTVKGNQPTLFAQLKALPWKDVPSHSSLQKGHGRRAHRAIKVLTAPEWITFAGAAQVAQIRRTTTRTIRGTKKKTVEVVYVITSADHTAAAPAVLADWVRNHWGIENRSHWVRDVTFDEDRSQIRTGNGPQVMACLRNTAISLLRLTGATNIAASLRHHAAKPERPINLVLTS